MSVKTSQSGTRILGALERIAENQPIGVSELARVLDTNVAAAQRAIATLAEAGWIRQAAGKPVRWELTGRIHSVAQHAYGSHDLRRRARGKLEELWRETGESVLLIVPDDRRFIVADVLESRHFLRSAPPIGLVVPPQASATAWAMLPYMTPAQQLDFLDMPPDAAMERKFAATKKRGYAISRGDVFAGSTNLAAPIFDMDSRPIGAVLISVPNDRAGTAAEAQLGALVLATARNLSHAEGESDRRRQGPSSL